MYLEGRKVSWLQLMILPDVRPENFMGQKHCVTIYSYTTPQCLILEKVFFFPGDCRGAFTSPLSQRLCQG